MTESTSIFARVRSWLKPVGLAALVTVTLVGCNRPKMAQVKGTVTYHGAPVTGGTVILNPVGAGNVGAPASATVGEDGSFTVATFGKNDGAIVGKHRIIYTPPEPELTEEQRTDPNYNAPRSPYAGLRPRQAEVEVQTGRNEMEIQLDQPH